MDPMLFFRKYFHAFSSIHKNVISWLINLFFPTYQLANIRKNKKIGLYNLGKLPIKNNDYKIKTNLDVRTDGN